MLIRALREEIETQALLCTDLRVDSERSICWFVRRWQMEVTLRGAMVSRVRDAEAMVREDHPAHRPALLGLFSLIMLLVHWQMQQRVVGSTQRSAWYDKPYPTFSDAFAPARRQLRA